MKLLAVLPILRINTYAASTFREHLPNVRALGATLAIGTIVCACFGQQDARGRGAQGRSPVDIRIELAQERFVTKESIVARILIRNTGSTAIEVPNPENNGNTQPVYTISGASYPKGHSFHFRGVVSGNPNAAPQIGKGSLIKLAPGQTHEAALPLEQLVRFPHPGSHTITASLEVNGAKATSPPVGFIIEPTVIRSMQLLIDDGAQSSNPIRVLCLVGDHLYQAIIREERPDLGEIFLAKLVPVARADPNATAVFGPWTNHNRLDSLLNRFGWQAGAVLTVEGLAGSPALKFTFPTPPQRLIRPAVMPESGEVDVLALTGDGKTLQLVRFPIARPGAEAKLQWSLQLPAVPVGARATLAPKTGGARRAAVLVSPDSGGVRMTLVEADPADAAPDVRSVAIDGAVLLPDSQPAITIAPDGKIRASAIFAEDPSMRRMFVADVTWPSGTGEGTVAKAAAGRLPGPPRAAAVAYSVASRPATRRDWLVLLRDGTVIFSGSPTRPRQLDGSLMLPLDLLGMSQMTYLLTLDRQGLPRLELMH
jgi:hypothetical protein